MVLLKYGNNNKFPYLYIKEMKNMLCTTVRNGKECVFMAKAGCTISGGVCQEIVQQCEGCGRIVELGSGKYCQTFPEPIKKWNVGVCNMATHAKVTVVEKVQKINPIKASKRGGN